jgi:CO/xanthine dehydrogenase Mo-binding subunit
VPQVCWAYECQMDDIARRLGIDPVALRQKNLVHEGYTYVTGDRLESIGLSDCLEQVAQGIGWQGAAEQAPRPPGPLVRGKGLAVMIKTTMTPSNSTATVRLNADGSAALLTSSVEIGQGTHTSLAQIVAEVLRLRPDRVSVSFPDTDVTPFDQSTSSSRTVFSMGHAAQQAAGRIREQLLDIGAKALESRVEDLELGEDGVAVRGAPARQLTVPQLFAAHFGAPVGSLLGHHSFQTSGGADPRTGKAKGRISVYFFLSACAAEVEVDTETGKVRVLRMASAVDAGKAINPKQCHLQNEGSMLTELGAALFEEMVFDEGQPINASFVEYMLPSLEDHPQEYQSFLVETPHPLGPFGAKGVGEAALGPVGAAIGNAVTNALGGVRLRDLPLRPDRVLAALAAAKGARA